MVDYYDAMIILLISKNTGNWVLFRLDGLFFATLNG